MGGTIPKCARSRSRSRRTSRLRHTAVSKPGGSLQCPFDDKLHHAHIVHATEPVLKTGKVVLDAEIKAGNRRIGEGWLVQVQDDL